MTTDMTFDMTFWMFFALAVIAIVGLFLLAGMEIAKQDKETVLENRRNAKKSADKILESVSWESKQRWVTDQEIEFVSILLGLVPSRHKVWARVHVSKKTLAVTIEYYYDADQNDRMWMDMVVDAFRERDVSVITRCADRQPRADEIFVPPSRPPNEMDDPKSLFSID